MSSRYATTGLTLEVYSGLNRLPPSCDKLFEANTGRAMFNRREWYRTVVNFGTPATAKPYFLVVTSAHRPIALFPMKRLVGGRCAESLTTPYTCLFEPLLDPSIDGSTRRRVFDLFARFCRGHATVRLEALSSDWPALPSCLSAAHAAGLLTCKFDHFGNWHESVAGISWQTYWRQRPSRLRETIRRRLARHQRDPSSQCEIVSTVAEIEAAIETFEAVYARSWKQPEPFPRFNAEWMREATGLGIVRLGIYRVMDQAVAVQLWISEHGRATVLKLAHDEQFRSISPGTTLTALMLKHLLDEEHVTELDFGRGDDEYKRDWANARRQRIGVVFVNPLTARGVCFLVVHMAGRAKQLIRR